MNEALDFADDKPFANENLPKARKWLRFRGLVVCEITAGSMTLSQQIVQYLNNKVPHRFRLRVAGGNTVVPKGILLLVAIAHLYAIRIIVFSTRRKPVVIPPQDTEEQCRTIAILNHKDSILSIGEWYPLGLDQDWIRPTAAMPAMPASTDTAIISPPAIQRPKGEAPKRKAPVDYKSISDDTLKNLLRVVT